MFRAAEHSKNTVSLLINGGCWIIYVDEYRSGHNEAVLKTVSPKGHGGSNPSSSAINNTYILWGGGVRLRDEAMPKGPDTAVEETKAEK